MKTTRGFQRKGGGRQSCPPAEVLGSPQLSPTTGGVPARNQARSSICSGGFTHRRREEECPASPFPHLITSHQHLELTTPGEEPADTGRGKGRGRPRQAEPGREGRETAKDQHARGSNVGLPFMLTETITRSDRSPSSLVSLIRKMKFRRVQKNRPWGLRAEIFWHPN